MRRMRWLMLAFLGVMALMAGLHRPTAHDANDAQVIRTAPAAPAPAIDAAADVVDTRDALPPEADATLALIAAGGPFPYDRDGQVFGNFEGRLPKQPRGWYHEYTVPTPGLSHRGARRIVAGGKPPTRFWYTDDHYETFREIEAKP
jgi:guanyl-specific ribonuclease Sa